MENKDMENKAISDEELEQVSGGEWDSGRGTGKFHNAYIYGPNGDFVDWCYKDSTAKKIAKEHNGFVVSGEYVDGSTNNFYSGDWLYEAVNHCCYASDGFMNANPYISPHWRDQP